MRIGWDSIAWLMGEVLQKNDKSSQDVVRSFPARFIARVMELKGDKHALLRWEGHQLWARVDVPVKKGEYLLLQFKSLQQDKHHFKVLARSFEPGYLDVEQQTAAQHLLAQNFRGWPIPLIYRFYINPEDQTEKEKKQGRDFSSYILEFIVETQNLGVVVVRIEKKISTFYGRLLVETEEAGAILQEDLNSLQNLLTLVLKERNIQFIMGRWGLLSITEKENIYDHLLEAGFVLDKRV